MGHLRLICEGDSKVFLLLQVEVRCHEVKQLLGQKLGLEGEQNGKRVSDERLLFLKHAISGLHNFLEGMSQSSRTSIQMILIKPKGVDNEDRVINGLRPSALFPGSLFYQQMVLAHQHSWQTPWLPSPHRRTFFSELTGRCLIKNIHVHIHM